MLEGLIAAAPLRPFFAAPACPPTRGRDNGGPPGPRTLQAEQRSIHAPLPATGCSPPVGHWSKHISIYQRGGGPRLARSRQDASTSGTGTVTLERRWALTGGVCTRAGVGGAFPRRSRQAPPQGGGRPGKRRPTSARARIDPPRSAGRRLLFLVITLFARSLFVFCLLAPCTPTAHFVYLACGWLAPSPWPRPSECPLKQ